MKNKKKIEKLTSVIDKIYADKSLDIKTWQFNLHSAKAELEKALNE